jgi:hypothetical protein
MELFRTKSIILMAGIVAMKTFFSLSQNPAIFFFSSHLKRPKNNENEV